MTRASLALVLVVATSAMVAPRPAEARARCADPARCGMVDVEIMPPLPTPDPVPLPRAPLPVARVRARLVALGPRVDECFAAHFEGERAPARFHVTVFVHPDGRWSLAFGARPRRPARDAELRGASPLEVCVSDWVSSELGPRLQPLGGRVDRRVAVAYRPHLPPPVAPAASPLPR